MIAVQIAIERSKEGTLHKIQKIYESANEEVQY